ncbi:MAG: hypothetical protein B2I17_06105 [Thermoplasmatales archaeon B_DKE]|nr:MAG: hypothetical protein B2I17_06105 [Thermoplasmatales archaeon B_DKE]QRF75744.1 Trehalose/maltose import ATP-binding protein MalK [Thermoplasmatales archaeon]
MRIKFRNLSVSFRDSVALNNVDLDIDAKRVVLLGQNGSGKTTLMAVMSGLLRPTNGEAYINDTCPYNEREISLDQLSYMFGVSRYPYRIRVRDFLRFLQKTRSCGDVADLAFYAEILGQIMDKRMNELSSGETKLVAVINAIYCTRSTLILDEPFAFLDAFRSSKLIDQLVKSGREYVFSTHIPEEAEGVGDYFVLLDRGEIKWNGTFDDLYRDEIFEVYISPGYVPEFGFIFRYGNVCLVKGESEKLYESMKRGEIRGFRQAGVRRVYYETR